MDDAKFEEVCLNCEIKFLRKRRTMRAAPWQSPAQQLTVPPVRLNSEVLWTRRAGR
jgi:hypothetical protein